MRNTVLASASAVCLCAALAFASTSPQKPSAGQSKTTKRSKSAAPAPAAKGVAKARTADDQWALLIGVSTYPGQIQSLTFPRSDARALKELLVSGAAFREDHIRLLTDDGAGPAKATKQNILAAVDDLARRVLQDHQLIVFLAGHGIARGLGAQARSYFLPVDVDATSKESLERTGVDLEEFSRRLSALKASQFTLFIDTCREDPFPGRGIKGNTMSDVMARGLRITPQGGSQSAIPTSVVFYACRVGQRAYEDPALQHGVFTYYILRGIRELASRPDGRVEAGALASYLRDNVQKWSAEFQQRARFPVEQTPTMTATEIRGPLVIVHVSPIAASLPQPPSAGAIVLDTSPADATLTLNGQALGTGPVEKQLPAGQYTLHAELTGFQPVDSTISVLPGYRQEVTVTLKPAAPNANYEKGVHLEEQGLWPQAIASYEQALGDDPGSIATCERLAGAYSAAARYRDAVDLLTNASEKNPDNAVLLARRSRALSDWAREDEKQDLSVNARPDKAIKQKDARKEAVRTAELAVRKASELEASELALGYAYCLDEHDRQKALSSFVRASTIAPDDPEGYFGAGLTYRLMKEYGQAIPQLKKAIELRPDYYEAHRELAYCYHASGDTDPAIREYNMATGYRGETNNSGEMAGNHLALSALYTEKGQEVGGPEGQAYVQAGKGYESEAREYDPTLKVALGVLRASGVANRMQRYLPSELRGLANIDDKGVTLPGGIKIPLKKHP